MYRYIIRPVLFLIDPEKIHNLVCSLIVAFQKIEWLSAIIRRFFTCDNPVLEKQVMGLRFRNPVGVAAGFDKNGIMVDALADFGFGFVEIGTITPLPQPGNPVPRLFRLKKDRALINRMGFNNSGMEFAARSLKRKRSGTIVGGNIGKNKNTPNENAVQDYLKCFNELYDLVDYVVVNVSSPNTPGLRELQDKGPLKIIMQSLQEVNTEKSNKPLLIKIAPDLTNEQLDDISEIIIETKISGIIATNTTLSRAGLMTRDEIVRSAGEGGLSGNPLFKRSLEVVGYLRKKLGKDRVIIGAGGIMDPEGAAKMMDAGADLIQLYTGFIYEGPGIAKKICNHLAEIQPAGTA